MPKGNPGGYGKVKKTSPRSVKRPATKRMTTRKK
jgi:hypothetical protein